MSSPVFMFDDSDPEMRAAYKKARETFRYFWREVAWERRRIVPGLDLACVKAPFTDGKPGDKDAEVEHMWLSDVEFDGKQVSGVLLNAPNSITSVAQGDTARLALDEISDWMYAIHGEVFGGYTVNLMRSRMGRSERNEHDQAWGLNFGDPKKVRLVPEQKSGGWFSSWFGGASSPELLEHPMSEGAGPSLKEQLAENPSMLTEKDDRGWTMLHHQALAGSVATVKVLLECGADAGVKTDHGMTPLQLAKSLGWDKVVALLRG